MVVVVAVLSVRVVTVFVLLTFARLVRQTLFDLSLLDVQVGACEALHLIYHTHHRLAAPARDMDELETGAVRNFVARRSGEVHALLLASGTARDLGAVLLDADLLIVSAASHLHVHVVYCLTRARHVRL